MRAGKWKRNAALTVSSGAPSRSALIDLGSQRYREGCDRHLVHGVAPRHLWVLTGPLASPRAYERRRRRPGSLRSPMLMDRDVGSTASAGERSPPRGDPAAHRALSQSCPPGGEASMELGQDRCEPPMCVCTLMRGAPGPRARRPSGPKRGAGRPGNREPRMRRQPAPSAACSQELNDT